MDGAVHRTAARFDFPLARTTAVYVCGRVRRGEPILYVSHDEDGDWQFLCGGRHGRDIEDRPCVACLECVIADDPTLNELANLGEGCFAQRDATGERWRRGRHP